MIVNLSAQLLEIQKALKGKDSDSDPTPDDEDDNNK
jgi:hypothetical protein